MNRMAERVAVLDSIFVVLSAQSPSHRHLTLIKIETIYIMFNVFDSLLYLTHEGETVCYRDQDMKWWNLTGASVSMRTTYATKTRDSNHGITSTIAHTASI